MNGRSLSRALVVLCVLLSLIAAPLLRPAPVLASAPQTPTNQSPSNGDTGVSLTPTLRASDFSDEDGDSHSVSKWGIGGQEYESSAQLTSFQVPSGLLDYSTTYSWQVCYTDNAGENSAWSSEWSFTTMDQPAEAPVVTTETASGIGTTTATLNGTLADLGTAGSVSVHFQWGTSTSYGGETASAGPLTAEGGFSAALSGLTPETTYHFRAVAAGDGTVAGSDRTFTTDALPELPVVTTGAASDIGTTTATLNGTLADLGTAGSVSVSFQWGTSTSYGETASAAGPLTAEGGFSAGLSGLTPETTYHFRAVAVSEDGSDSGDDVTFTTDALPKDPPSVTTGAASAIATTTATLNGTLADLGTAGSVSVSFQWGTSTSYGETASAGTMTAEGGFSVGLSGLAAETTYHFRAVAAGDGTVSGSDRTFTTGAAPTEPPAVTTGAASGIGTTSATLNMTLNGPGTAESVQVYFEWGPTADYGYSTPAEAMDDAGSMSQAVSGLAPETTYHFRAVAEGDGPDFGADRTFTTQALPDEPPAVTTHAASAIGTTSATLNLNLAGLGSAASVRVYFEWGLTTEYGNTTTPRTVSRTGSSTFALSGLSPETAYHFRARAEGDGAAQGEDLSFTTSGAPAAPPVVATVAAGDIGTISATLNLDLTGLGSAAAVQVSFEWGLTSDYGQDSLAQAMEGPGVLSQPISGLVAASTYHFRAVAVGDGTAYGSDLTFATGSVPASPPRVKTGDVQSVSTESARLGAELTSLGSARSVTVSFVWGTSPGGPYPNETQGAAREQGGEFHVDLDGLALGTTYYLQARAVGDGISYGVEKSFTTVGLAPRIDSLMAYKGQQGSSLMLKITGSNLGQATQVDLGAGVHVRQFTVVSDSEIRAEVGVDSNAKSGGRQIAVTTPSGTAYYSVPAGFLTGVPGDSAEADDTPRASMWIYLVVVAVGVVGALLLVPLEVALWRRHKRQQNG